MAERERVSDTLKAKALDSITASTQNLEKSTYSDYLWGRLVGKINLASELGLITDEEAEQLKPKVRLTSSGL